LAAKLLKNQQKPHEFARLVGKDKRAEKMNGTVNPRRSGDMGIDGWEYFKARTGQAMGA